MSYWYAATTASLIFVAIVALMSLTYYPTLCQEQQAVQFNCLHIFLDSVCIVDRSVFGIIFATKCNQSKGQFGNLVRCHFFDFFNLVFRCIVDCLIKAVNRFLYTDIGKRRLPACSTTFQEPRFIVIGINLDDFIAVTFGFFFIACIIGIFCYGVIVLNLRRVIDFNGTSNLNGSLDHHFLGFLYEYFVPQVWQTKTPSCFISSVLPHISQVNCFMNILLISFCIGRNCYLPYQRIPHSEQNRPSLLS